MIIENVNRRTCGSSVWNMGRKPGDELMVDLNLGNVEAGLQDLYIAIAEARLSDDLSDNEVEEELSRGIWDAVCNA